ncbi:MAG: isoprenylcysteine carboxylmethyltransferase family protein [Gemmatimonadales bacterium]|jgi:protein-S-isoprenylcysteine O-methyltransferase Ste14
MSPPSRLASAWLALRSALWTALVPGVVAGYVPWTYFGLAQVRLSPFNPRHVLGLVGMGAGVALGAACIWQFARRGGGTLAPVDPPNQLVVRGPYRFLRNPMYLSVTTILLGEFLLTRSPALLSYWAIWFALVNLFVIGYEEPTLRRRFGTSYERYAARVGRWIPRRHRSE